MKKSELKDVTVSCLCSEKKDFTHSFGIDHSGDQLKETKVVIDCPYTFEKNCLKRFTIILPPGLKPTKDGGVLRG